MKRRIFAWIGIIIIPLLFAISLVLSILEVEFAPAFLMVTIVISVVVPVVIYLLLKWPKDMADMYLDLKDKVNEKHES